MSDERSGPDESRLEALEQAVRGLQAQVEALRAEVHRAVAAPAATAAPTPAAANQGDAEAPAVVPLPLRRPLPPPTVGTVRAERPDREPSEAGAAAGSSDGGSVGATGASGAPPRPRPLPPRATVSGGVVSGGLEQAIGRYGTLVVATFAILLGLGAFLQWAVARGLLGPEMRVALGAVAAVVLAALGVRLRSKGSRTFGNALLAIALAVVHLVAWGAGPVLGLVPPMVALGLAAVASVALAALALREDEEFLFLLGLGGALLAPFVTMEGNGGPGQLLLFGGVVLAAAIVALRDEAWRAAPRLLSPFAFGYMAAAVPMRRDVDGMGALYWPTAFALTLALVALAAGARGVRRGVVKGMLFLVAFGIVVADGHRDLFPWTGLVYAVLGTLVVHALRRRSAATEDGGPDTWVEVVGFPLLFLLAVLTDDDAWKQPEGAPIAMLWVALTTVFLLVDAAAVRARHLTVMLTAAIAATASLYHGDAVQVVPAFAIVAAVSVFTFHRVPGKSLLLPIGLSLGFATLRAMILIDRRAAWEYTPFLNQTALVGATVVAAWLLLSWVAPRAFAVTDAGRKPWEPESPAKAFAVLGPVVAFFWIRSELREAFSYDVATFLLITYYALTGVGTILLGRAREVDALRQTGLALSLFAAGKAFVAASDLDSIGFRVGSYLIVGVFLLGVGYLYRAAATDGTEAAA